MIAERWEKVYKKKIVCEWSGANFPGGQFEIKTELIENVLGGV